MAHTKQEWTADLVAFGITECIAETEPNGARIVDEVRSIESFEAADILTHDAGFVIRMTDGTEFQVTVVRSR